jgi:hypothetical protein
VRKITGTSSAPSHGCWRSASTKANPSIGFIATSQMIRPGLANSSWRSVLSVPGLGNVQESDLDQHDRDHFPDEVVIVDHQRADR